MWFIIKNYEGRLLGQKKRYHDNNNNKNNFSHTLLAKVKELEL